jgi:hypothetical protein
MGTALLTLISIPIDTHQCLCFADVAILQYKHPKLAHMYKKRNNSTDACRTAWRRRRSIQATQLKVTEHVVERYPKRLAPMRLISDRLK